MTINITRRKVAARVARVFALFLAAAAFVISARTAAGSLADRQGGHALQQVVREVTKGGPVSESSARQWQGSGVERNPWERIHAVARDALRTVSGVDYSRIQSAEDNVLNEWEGQNSIPTETRDEVGKEVGFLRYTAPAALGYLPTSGFPIYTPPKELRTWSDLSPVFEPLNNPMGRASLHRLLLLARVQNTSSALAAAFPPGSAGPEFAGERQDDTGTNTNTPRVATDTIVRPSSETSAALAIRQRLPVDYITAKPDSSGIAADHPDRIQSHPLTGASGQETITSTGVRGRTAGGLGLLAEDTGYGASPQIRSNFVSNAVLQVAAQAAADRIQQQLAALARVSDFFGPVAGGLSDIFGPDDFSDRLNDFAGGGGGGLPNTLADIPTQDNPPDATCAARTPTVSAEEAKGAAALLGLRPSTDPNTPWRANYAAAESLYGIRGRSIKTGIDGTIDATVFPDGKACVWVISARHVNQAAFVSDARNPGAPKFLLELL